GAMGIAMAMLFMLTMLPALLVVCGRRAFWPFVPDGPAGPVPPRTLRWRRVVYSILLGLFISALAAASGVASAGAVIAFAAGALLNYFVLAPAFHRFDVKELYPGIERRLAARHQVSDETHGVWRRIGERVAARPGR